MVLQCHLLWVEMLHQHPLTGFAGGVSTAVSQGSSQLPPPLTTEFTCSLCQIVRQSLGLSVAGLPPVQYVAVSISHVLPFSPGVYRSYHSIMVLGRAPPLS